MRSAPSSIMPCITASDSAVSGTFSACNTVMSGNASCTASAALVGGLVVAEVVLRADEDEADGVDRSGGLPATGALGRCAAVGGRRLPAAASVLVAAVSLASSDPHAAATMASASSCGEHECSGTSGGHWFLRGGWFSCGWIGWMDGGGCGMVGVEPGQKTRLSDSGASLARRRLSSGEDHDHRRGTAPPAAGTARCRCRWPGGTAAVRSRR